MLAGLILQCCASLQVIPGLVLRVDLESAGTPPQPVGGPLPSLWLLLLLWQPLGLNQALETGFEGVLSDGSLTVCLLAR